VRKFSNDKSSSKERPILKHLQTVRCPKCGAFYLAHDGTLAVNLQVVIGRIKNEQ